MNKIFAISVVVIFLLTLTSCKSESEKDFNELIKELNTDFGYNFEHNKFIIEKRENYIYHFMIDNSSLLSLYTDEENKIIQCTISSYESSNNDNIKLLSDICMILTKQSMDTVKNMIESATANGSCVQNGWNIAIINNGSFITYLINHKTNPINDNQLPTLKNKITS